MRPRTSAPTRPRASGGSSSTRRSRPPAPWPAPPGRCAAAAPRPRRSAPDSPTPPENRKQGCPRALGQAAHGPPGRRLVRCCAFRSASDDQFVHGYKVSITDVATGAGVGRHQPEQRGGQRLLHGPAPRIRGHSAGHPPGRHARSKAIDNRVADGQANTQFPSRPATSIRQHRATAITFTFVAGELHRDTALAAACGRHRRRSVNRLLGCCGLTAAAG